MNTNLEYLKILTENLPPIEAWAKHNPHDSTVDYELEKGTCIGFHLYSAKDVAIQRSFLSIGARVQKHNHPEKEWLIVYRGKVIISWGDNNSRECGPGEFVYFLNHETHWVEALEDTWIICITIPASIAYPHDQE